MTTKQTHYPCIVVVGDYVPGNAGWKQGRFQIRPEIGSAGF